LVMSNLQMKVPTESRRSINEPLSLKQSWTSMAVFKCSMACLLAAILCGCSGFPAERAIRVPFSAIADSDADRLLTQQQVTELEDLLRLTDETFLRHGLGFTFREDEQDPSKWKRVFGHTTLREYRPLPWLRFFPLAQERDLYIPPPVFWVVFRVRSISGSLFRYGNECRGALRPEQGKIWRALFLIPLWPRSACPTSRRTE
jgi:hypothetical protein